MNICGSLRLAVEGVENSAGDPFFFQQGDGVVPRRATVHVHRQAELLWRARERRRYPCDDQVCLWGGGRGSTYEGKKGNTIVADEIDSWWCRKPSAMWRLVLCVVCCVLSVVIPYILEPVFTLWYVLAHQLGARRRRKVSRSTQVFVCACVCVCTCPPLYPPSSTLPAQSLSRFFCFARLVRPYLFSPVESYRKSYIISYSRDNIYFVCIASRPSLLLCARTNQFTGVRTQKH